MKNLLFFQRADCYSYQQLSSTEDNQSNSDLILSITSEIQENLISNKDHLKLHHLPNELIIKIASFLKHFDIINLISCSKYYWRLRKPIFQFYLKVVQPQFLNNFINKSFDEILRIINLINNHQHQLQIMPSLSHTHVNNPYSRHEEDINNASPCFMPILLTCALGLTGGGIYIIGIMDKDKGQLSNSALNEIKSLAAFLLIVGIFIKFFVCCDWYRFHSSYLDKLDSRYQKLSKHRDILNKYLCKFPSWIKEYDERIENLEFIAKFLLKKIINLSPILTKNYRLETEDIENKSLRQISYYKKGILKKSGFFTRNSTIHNEENNAICMQELI